MQQNHRFLQFYEKRKKSKTNSLKRKTKQIKFYCYNIFIYRIFTDSFKEKVKTKSNQSMITRICNNYNSIVFLPQIFVFKEENRKVKTCLLNKEIVSKKCSVRKNEPFLKNEQRKLRIGHWNILHTGIFYIQTHLTNLSHVLSFVFYVTLNL